MNFITATSFLVFLFIFQRGYAQIDSARIISYADRLMVRVNLDTNIEGFVFSQGTLPDARKTVLTINNKATTSLSFDYKLFSVTLSMTPRFISGGNKDEQKGHSSYTDFSFRLFPKRFIQSVYYKNVRGFYVDNMKDLVPGWEEGRDPYIRFPGLQVQSYGGTTSYILNKNFSAKSIYTQGEWQKHSGGSWIPSVDYDLTIFKNTDNDNANKAVQYKIGGNMGYFYNWVIGKKVNIAPYLALGLGAKFASYRNVLGDGKKENTQYLTIRTEGGLHAGYNTDRFLFGGKINFNASAYNQKKDQTIENNYIYGLLYIGYRFAPPKVVKKTYDKIEKTIPLL
ncbi:DUF4421 family protein [Chryseobacterium sp.]|uniref:DUF4421 family protein n=1 Tax=Chryseobacterium sp. TaxID=1871047 RepID=UPI0025B86B7F|nr:DUF4421 family protein [Chryseobacterium sp.]MBV8327137.1 DUF4421 family protein [Chryseobacterium sp.]